MGIIKTNEEVIKLKKAAELGEKCFENVCKKINVGMSEKEIASLVYDFFVKNGAEGLSFDTIVGSGINSAQIHSTPSEKVIQNNDIIQFDMGCILNGYCSDMSRVVFIGTPTQKQIEIYNIVYETYINAVEKIKPLMNTKEADAYGRKYINENGFDYAHALGHGVGTEVHEMPILSPKKIDILKTGMVFSIEPGIYIENEFGIRIEDVGVLTENGLEMFTKAPKKMIIL